VFKTKTVTLHEGIWRTLYFSAALLIGLLITSMSTFPSMHHTNVTSQRAGGVGYEYAQSFSLHPEEVVSFVQPDFSGVIQGYWGQNALKYNTEYFGVTVLVCAILLFVVARPGFTFILLSLFMFFALLFALGSHTPFHFLVYSMLPGIKAFRAPSMMYIWIYFPAFVLAAFGIKEIIRLKESTDTKRKKRLLVTLGIVGGFFLLSLFALKPFSTFWYNTFYPAELKVETANQVLSRARQSGDQIAVLNARNMVEQAQRKKQAFEYQQNRLAGGGAVVFICVGALLLAIFLYINDKVSRNTALMLIAAAMLLDTIRISRPFLTMTFQKANYFTGREKWEAQIARRLNDRDTTLFRVHQLIDRPKMYIPGLDLTYIFDDFTNKHYDEAIKLLQRSYDNPLRAANLLSLLNTRYVISPMQLPWPGFTEILKAGDVSIFQNERAFPFFYCADSLVVDSATTGGLLRYIASPSFKRATALVDTPLFAFSADTVDSTGAPIRTPGTVSITSYDIRHGHAKVTVTTPGRQLLVFSQNFNPSWKATIDGAPTRLVRANYTFMGVVCEPGTHTVTFTYHSTIAHRWRTITLFSTIGYLLFAVGVGVLVVRRKKEIMSNDPEKQ